MNILLTLFCAAWTYNYRERTIVSLSQPKFLYYLCCGCFISTMSSVAPLLGSSDLSCQLMVWLYGCGFFITTATLYFKMQQMNKMIENSIATRRKKARSGWFKVFNSVVVVMASGEFAILALWSVVAPLQYKRRCVTYEKGGVWHGACRESVGKCRTTHGVVFVAVLSVYHVCCVLTGMYMCYTVRNLPSIMAEGKWVFTGFYSQLQVFVTAVPVLIMVKEDYLSFTILKSLVICIGDITTLAMVFVPKMLLVYKYYDFDVHAVASFFFFFFFLKKYLY